MIRKLLIYLSAFSVSFVLLYSIYYYVNIKRSDRGVVVNADELTRSAFGLVTIDSIRNKNLVLSNAFSQASETPHVKNKPYTELTAVPASQFLSFSGEYNDRSLDELNELISSKLKKHPPVSLGRIKNGDRFQFTYVFNNIRMPKEFSESEEPIFFDENTVRALQFSSSDSVYMYRDSLGTALKFKSGDIEGVYLMPSSGFSTQAILSDIVSTTDSVMKPENAVKSNALIPDIDIYIERIYNPESLKGDHSSYSHIEDRLKIKTTAISEGDSMLNGTILFDKPFIFFLKEKESSKPYLVMVIRNAELLVKVPPKR